MEDENNSKSITAIMGLSIKENAYRALFVEAYGQFEGERKLKTIKEIFLELSLDYSDVMNRKEAGKALRSIFGRPAKSSGKTGWRLTIPLVPYNISKFLMYHELQYAHVSTNNNINADWVKDRAADLYNISLQKNNLNVAKGCLELIGKHVDVAAFEKDSLVNVNVNDTEWTINVVHTQLERKDDYESILDDPFEEGPLLN